MKKTIQIILWLVGINLSGTALAWLSTRVGIEYKTFVLMASLIILLVMTFIAHTYYEQRRKDNYLNSRPGYYGTSTWKRH